MPAVSQRTLKQGSMDEASQHEQSFDFGALHGAAPGSGDRGDPRRKKSQPYRQHGISPYSPVVRVQGSGVSLNPPVTKVGASGRVHNHTVQPVHIKAGLDVSSTPLGSGARGTIGSKGRETPDD